MNVRRLTSSGFTLIELILIIVILGILSVMIMPKLFDLSRETRIKQLEYLRANIEQAATFAYTAAVMAGVEKNSRSAPSAPPVAYFNGQPLELKYGYPEAQPEGGLGIVDLLDISGEYEVFLSGDDVRIGYDTDRTEGCYVRYIEPGGTGAPSETQYGILIFDVGC